MANGERSRIGSKREMKPGVWDLALTHGRDSLGRQRRLYRRFEGTDAEADRELARMAVEMGASPSLGDPRTVGEYWPWFLRRCELKGLARETLRDYETQWRLRIEPEFGSCRWPEVTRRRIQQWVYGMTHSQAVHSVRCLRRMINCAVDDELCDRNPLDHRRIDYPVDQVDPLAPPPAIWGAPQVAECMDRLAGDRVEPLWLALVGGGLRVEEGLAMWWDDVSLSPVTHMDGTAGAVAHLSVTKAWTVADGLKVTKNRYSTRIVPVPDPFASRLADLLRPGPRAGLWPGYPHKARAWWKSRFAPDGPLAGMPYAHLKDMRAVHETMLQDAGVLDTLNARLHGRTNVQTGYRHYLKPSSSLDAAVDGLRVEMDRIAR